MQSAPTVGTWPCSLIAQCWCYGLLEQMHFTCSPPKAPVCLPPRCHCHCRHGHRRVACRQVAFLLHSRRLHAWPEGKEPAAAALPSVEKQAGMQLQQLGRRISILMHPAF
jgi:hypothetical protein